ncbi:hypothetical protein C8R45DRAFT_1035635 [Mycena sanguinolenta]|nr:hypothetical protein C8R45DRAFT_1035635 [Mycena sanguinolenta]
MPIRHAPCRVFRVAQPPLHSQSLFIHALTLHRPVKSTRRQSRFIRTWMSKKESIVTKRQITAHLHTLRKLKAHDVPKPQGPAPLSAVSSSPCAQRSSLANQAPFAVHRDSPPVLLLKMPRSALISPSKFSSPLTPANQVLRAPFHPPEPPKRTPSKHCDRTWQWSPVVVSPGVDENCAPLDTPDTPESPISYLTRRLSRIAPLSSSPHVPRRLSYSHVCTSGPWTPEPRHSQALASPAMIRSSLWPSSPVASPRYQLDDLQFSPFHVVF